MAVQKNQNTTIYILIALVIILITTNIFTFLKVGDTKKELEISEADKIELQTDLAEMQLDLDESLEQLNTKDSALMATNAELQSKVDQIKKMLATGKINRKKLDDYKDEIDQLKYYIKKYQGEIDVLKAENQQLTSENKDLKTVIKVEQQKTDNLLTENITLNNKVSVAQLLKTSKITSIPYRTRSNGEEKQVDRAKTVEGVNVCFNIADNPIAGTGGRAVYIQIFNPLGRLEAITDQTGSKFIGEGEEKVYTSKVSVDFQNKGKQYCGNFQKSSSFEKGTYSVKLYCDQFLMGQSSFELK
ncbi:MAG: myosin heavy subunit [Sphingobacteriales bacterium]|jgi:myosin heavy subunit